MGVNLVSKEVTTKNQGCNLSNLSDFGFNEKYKFDSLAIYIPLNEVTIIDDYFGGLCVIQNLETGAKQKPEEALRQTEYRDEKHPEIRTVFRILKQKFRPIDFAKGADVPEYLCVFLNAKQLQENYLLGLNKDTIKDAYNYIINLGAVKFTLESFMNAYVLDVDVCKDFVCPKSIDHSLDRDNLFKKLKSEVKEAYELLVNTYKRTTLYYNREGRRRPTLSKPHIQIYDKSAELLGVSVDQIRGSQSINKVADNSFSFYHKYLAKNYELEDIITNGILRTEITLSNSQFFKAVDLSGTRTLSDLMAVSQNELDYCFKYMFSKYYEGTLMEEKEHIEGIEGLTPDKMALVSTIEFICNARNDYNTEDILKVLTKYIKEYKNKQTLYAKREDYKELIELIIPKRTRSLIKQNDALDQRKIEVLKTIGLYD